MTALGLDPEAARAVVAELRSLARQLGDAGGTAAGGTFAEVAATVSRADAAAAGVGTVCEVLAGGLLDVVDGVDGADRSTGGAGVTAR